jgi:hypothetical protein
MMDGMELFDLIYAHQAQRAATRRLAAATDLNDAHDARHALIVAQGRVSKALTAVMRAGAASETTVVYAAGSAYVVELDPAGDDGLQYSVRQALVISDGSDLVC